jgi:putative SOS response-associated peptidase YedK
MVSAYSFNSTYQPARPERQGRPSLRLLEGGQFTPGQFAPVLIEECGQMRLRFFRWGLAQGPAKAGRSAEKRFTLPAEGALERPASAEALRRQRCLIPADGIYLHPGGNPARTVKLARPDQEAFCLAGLFEAWAAPDGSLEYAFALLTAPAPAALAPLSLAIPLILPRHEEDAWLDPQTTPLKMAQLLASPARMPLQAHPVALLDLEAAEMLAA